jgi:outer membrane lipoprotein-sorting protein
MFNKQKIFLTIGLLFFPVVLMANVNKAEIIKKLLQSEKIQKKGLTGNIEINMPIMGNQENMPGTFWTKDGLFKIETTMQIPNQTSPVQSTIIFDGKTIWNDMGNTIIMKTNIDKLPLAIRNKMKNFTSFGLNFEKNINKYYKDINITEETEKTNKYYVINIEGQIIKQNIPSNINGRKKIILWINEKNMFPEKVEMFGPEGNIEMLVKFTNLSIESIPSSMFTFVPPKNVPVMDMTEMMTNILTGKSQMINKSTQTETR